MAANYHFHIHNLVQVSHSKIQQSTEPTKLSSKSVDMDALQQLIDSVKPLLQQIDLDQDKKQTLDSDLHTIAGQLGLKRPKISIVKKCLLSLRTGLNHAVSHVVAAEIIMKINGLLGK